MKLAFLDLPDHQVDMISTARRAPGVDLVLVANADPDSLALRIAEVLQIPHSTEPLDLLGLKPDRVALPSLESPGASALLRAGISPGIFVPLADLMPLVTAPPSDAAEEFPVGEWVLEPEEPEPGQRLGEIKDALALSDDRQRLFREILALAVSETGADTGSLMVVDEEEGNLRIAFADGLSPDTVRNARQKIGEGIAGTVAQNGTPLIINERVLDPRYREGRERPRIASGMSAPIKLDGRVIGVLNVSSDRRGARFEDGDLERLTEIGAQISAILDRVVRRSQSDLDSIEFRARQSVARIFESREGSRVERLRACATRLAEQLGARALEIYAPEPEGKNALVLAARSGPGEEGRVSLRSGMVARACLEGETTILGGHAAGGSATRVDAERGGAPRRSALSVIVVPIVGARIHGALSVERRASDEPDPEALAKVLSRIGAYLAGFLETRRTDGEAARRNALISILADSAPRLMVVREIEALALEAIGALRALFPVGLLSVRLLDLREELILRTAFEGSDAERSRAQEREASLAAKAVAEGIELSPATWDESGPSGSAIEPGEGSAAVVPVRTSDRVAGSLAVLRTADDPGAEPIAAAELEALRKLALYVSIAWEHIRGLGGEERETHDPVTGLLAGAGLETRIQEEVKRAERYHDRFLLTLCSIAEFGRLEARHGSAFTDRLLREFGAALARNVREVDAVARIGDGRFAVLSPETDKDSGALLKRLDLLVPRLECVQALENPAEITLAGRQYTYPDEIATGGELLALIRGEG